MLGSSSLDQPLCGRGARAQVDDSRYRAAGFDRYRECDIDRVNVSFEICLLQSESVQSCMLNRLAKNSYGQKVAGPAKLSRVPPIQHALPFVHRSRQVSLNRGLRLPHRSAIGLRSGEYGSRSTSLHGTSVERRARQWRVACWLQNIHAARCIKHAPEDLRRSPLRCLNETLTSSARVLHVADRPTRDCVHSLRWLIAEEDTLPSSVCRARTKGGADRSIPVDDAWRESSSSLRD